MPPKAKFSKEEIINTAIDFIREEGFVALTSRALGEKLGSSARPIFTVFRNMEELQKAVIEEAKAIYKEYVKNGLKEKPAFKGVGTQYILFSIQEPKLFCLLFMTEREEAPNINSVLPLIDESYDEILRSVKEEYGLDDEYAEKLYRHLWIYTHGIATLCATKMCVFTSEEISVMITEVFISLLNKMKAGNNDD